MIPKPSMTFKELEKRITDLESGKFNNDLSIIDSGTVSDDGKDWKEIIDAYDYKYTATVKFKKPFPSSPEVFVSISGISINDSSYWIEVEKVNEEGFLIVLKSEMSEIDYCSVNWLAYLQNDSLNK